ncbi:MAG: AAA family ATPase [Caldilineaceae bacterium]|nr:AAA family ATPase [Caldilineaceae bacterium]
MIQLFTFGTLQVVRDADRATAHAVTESDWHTRQARQLLKILITERPQPVSTDRLVDILWPESTPSAAATTLRSAINALRNVLEPERRSRAPSKYILTKTPGYAFHHHSDIWLDVAEFESLLDRAAQAATPLEQQTTLDAAAKLYQDDYLTSDPYADWAHIERERLRERYFAALLTLAELHAATGHYTAAIAACRRIIARDAVRENVYQALMRYQAESGDSASALLTYERCRALLAEELGADPSPLTQTWHQRILNGEIGPVTVAAQQSSGMISAPNRPQPRNQPTPIHSGQQQRQAAESPTPLILPPQTLPAQSFATDLDHTEISHFVGRDRELALLLARIERAQDGYGSLLLLEGEAGVGKTHLVHHLLQKVMNEPGNMPGQESAPREQRGSSAAGFTVIHATCQPLEQHLPFAPLSEALGRFLYSLPDEILRVLPAASLAQLAQLTPSLQDRLPDLPTLPVEAWSNSDENRQRLINGLITVLTTLANARPLILFVDDLHWADTDSLAVLGRLAQRLPHLPLLIMLAYRGSDLDANEPLATLLYTLRPHPYSPQSYHDKEHLVDKARAQEPVQPTVVLTVRRFDQHEVSILVSQLTQQAVREDAQLVTMLLATTQGNPLFVMEALRALQERQRSEPALAWQRLLAPTPSEQLLAADESLPTASEAILNLGKNPRVQEISLERIHRLPAAARHLLHLCSVIGRDFSLDLLEQVTVSTADTDLVANLDLLLQRKFLLERPDERLDFSHEIVRQVAYENMSILERRRLHRRVADALAALPRAQEIPGEIAFHYRQSGPGASRLTAQYRVLAGERLLHTYGFRQAVGYLDEALALLNRHDPADAPWVQRALEGRGLAYESLFDPTGVTQTYRELQQWATSRGDHTLLLTAYSRQVSMLGLLGQQRESNDLLQELIETLKTDDVDGETAERRRRGTAVMLDLFERRRQLFRPDPPRATAFDNEVWAAYTPPPPVVAAPVAAMLEALQPVHAVLPLFDYGWTLLIQGQLPEAVHCLETVVDLAQQSDQLSVVVIAYHQLAVAARMRGDLATCYARNEQSVAFHRKLQKRAGDLVSVWPRIGSSFAALQIGALDEAEQRLRRVIDVLQGLASFRNHRNSATIGLGLVALARGEIAQAEQLLHTALMDATYLYPYIHVQALLGLAKIADQRAEKSGVHQFLHQALRFAGERSLLEEYIDTLSAIRQLAPNAPVDQQRADVLAYVQALEIASLVDKLTQTKS